MTFSHIPLDINLKNKVNINLGATLGHGEGHLEPLQMGVTALILAMNVFFIILTL